MNSNLKIIISLIIALAVVVMIALVISLIKPEKEALKSLRSTGQMIKEKAPTVKANDIKPEHVENAKKPAVSKAEASSVSKDIMDMSLQELIEVLGGKDLSAAQEAADRIMKMDVAAVPDLLKAMASAPDSLKGQIAFILGRIKSAEAVPALIETLQDPNSYVRRNSAEALGKIADDTAMTPLVKALTDKDPGVRQYAAWALGQIGSVEASAELVKSVQSETDYSVKNAIVNSLGEIGDNEAATELIAQLDSQEDMSYKDEVVTALGNIGDAAAIPALNKYLAEIKQYKPTEPMLIFKQNTTISIIEEAIKKINSQNGIT